MPNAVEVVNIKHDMPSVDEARKRLLDMIKSAKARRVKAIKLIHGYGSTGVGGKLRDTLRSSLSRRRKEGVIRAFVAGERWDPFDPIAQETLTAVPELGRDSDLSRGNEGVTVVLL